MNSLIGESEDPAQKLAQLNQRVAELVSALQEERTRRQEREVWFQQKQQEYLEILEGSTAGTSATIEDINKVEAASQETAAALAESERQYRDLVKYAPSGIYEVDFRTQRFLSVNDAMCQVTGYSRDELLSMGPFALLDQPSKEVFQARINQWLSGKEPPSSVDYLIRAKDGREIWTNLQSAFTVDEKGHPRGATVVAHDITARKQAEMTLYENERRLSFLVKLNDALRPLSDPVLAQLAACRVLAEHLKADQVLYGDVMDEKQISIQYGVVNGMDMVIDSVNMGGLDENIVQSYRAGQWQVINDVQSDPNLGTEHKRRLASVGVAAHLSRGLIKDGRWMAALGVNNSSPRIWTQTELELVDETIQRIWATVVRVRAEEEARNARDLLEEKVAERTEELSRERQRLFDVLETLPASICLISPDYKIPFSNRAFRESCGESNDRQCYDYIYGLNEPCEGCQSLSPLVIGQPNHWIFTAPDGAIIDAYNFPFIDVDGTRMVLEMCIDITQQRKLEAELSRLDRLNLIGQMAAGIGHEIRNPMTAVRGFLQMLGAKPEYDDDLVFFELMIEELDRANGIISEFLALARDKMVDLQPGSLDLVINMLYPMIRAEANLREIKVQLELNGLSPCLIDRNEIRQLILNISRNAMEAMSFHGTLTIGTRPEGNEAVLYIRDEGGGLSPEIIDKLGTPFVTTKDNGTGLGLPICYSIAARHNARIDFKTGPDGTTFYVRFPMAIGMGADHMAIDGQGGKLTIPSPQPKARGTGQLFRGV